KSTQFFILVQIHFWWRSFQMENGQRITEHFKRHSDGTFTSDLTGSLDKGKAKNFVEWLASDCESEKYGNKDNLTPLRYICIALFINQVLFTPVYLCFLFNFLFYL
uniref:Glucagon / GIP / secretin / VIP family domain-containing protein n=1 Tax=Salarias fasciatus TaxID=181472 RepID=A0A672J4I2_SALFA